MHVCLRTHTYSNTHTRALVYVLRRQFMEHDVEALPIRTSVLADLAQKCHAYAKVGHTSTDVLYLY
jgi:hypothetical protein